MNQKGFTSLFIILGIILIIGITGGAYYLSQAKLRSVSIPQQSSTPQVTSAPVADQTANWQVFQSINGKYTIKYPKDLITPYQPDDGKGNVLFVLTKDQNNVKNGFWPISLSILWRANPGTSAEQALFQEGLNNCIAPCNKRGQELPVTINNAIGFTAKGTKDDYYFTNSSQTTPVLRLMFGFQSDKYTDANNEVKIFRQMIQTFRFTDQNSNDETANWKTYNSSRYGFSIKLPSQFQTQIQTDLLIRFVQASNKPIIDINIHPTDVSIQEWILGEKLCPTAASCSKQRPGPIPNSIQFDSLGRHYVSTDTLFKKDNDLFFDIGFSATVPDVAFANSDYQLYDQILSTFKFTQ